MTPAPQPTPAKSLKMYQEDEDLAAADTPKPPTVDDRLIAILERLADRQDQGPIAQIPLSKAKFQTPFNPSGERYTEELSRSTYLNGRRLTEMLLSPQEVALLNQLKPGKYHQNQWVVIESDSNSEGSALYLYVPDKTQEQRIALKGAARNFVHLLEQILDEQRAIVAR